MAHLDEGQPLHLSSIWALDKLNTKVIKPLACLIHIVHMETNVSIPANRSPLLLDCCTHRLQVMLSAQEQGLQLQPRAGHLQVKVGSMRHFHAVERHCTKSHKVQRENAGTHAAGDLPLRLFVAIVCLEVGVVLRAPVVRQLKAGFPGEHPFDLGRHTQCLIA